MSTTRDSDFDDFSYREYLDIRDHTKSYDGVIANTGLSAVGFSAQPGATPQVKGGMLVSGNYFSVLGVEPSLGRGFRADEDEVPGRDAVAVLGPDFWKHEFAGDPTVVGRKIRLNGTEFTVIGVAPETFTGMLHLLAARLLHAAGDGAGVFDQPAEELPRGPGRSRADRAGAPEAGHDARARHGRSSPCWREDSSATIRRSIATAARRCAPSSRCAREVTTKIGSSA